MSLRALYDVPAPAKINLFLHIVGRRPDGYHLLQSVFVLVDWSDTLHFEARSDGRLQRHDLGPALPADDLCLRAAQALQAASGTRTGADISILKTVPWGAGMGGGSSDAASTLLALNRLWGLNWSRERLAKLGLALGADVPFFIGGDNAIVQGVGERLTPLALPVAHYAIVKPPTSIATRDIFEHPALKRDTEALDEAAILLGSVENTVGNCLGAAAQHGDTGVSAQAALNQSALLFGTNDLQAAAEDRCPEVAQAARWLKSRYGNSRMTGSGSAVFSKVGTNSVSETDSAASPVATLLAAEVLVQFGPAWVGRLCLGLQQHPLRGWAS